MSEHRIRVSRHGAKRWRQGHPWIFRGDAEGSAPAGELVEVVAPGGRKLGVAAWSDASNIALRRVPLPEGAPDPGWLALVKAALERRADRPEACRLVNADADGLPGLVVDRYGEGLSLQLTTQAADRRGAAVVDLLRARFDPRVVALRNDVKARGFEGLPQEKRLLRGDSPVVEASFGGVTMRYDLLEGQKTGGYLDQSDNRVAAARFAVGEALDICSYDGGFSLHLAAAGRPVTALDASAPALSRLEANAALNGLSVSTVCANAFDQLRAWEGEGRRFDTIVLDPPALVPSRRAVEKGRRAYKELNLRAFKLLAPGGRLVTCSCSAHMSRPDFERVVGEAAADAHRWARVVERRSAAPDHPSLLTAPETDYLKVLFVEVTG